MLTESIYPFNEENIRNAPTSNGIYVLYQNGKVIYIGRSASVSTSIQSRLIQHKIGDEGPCTQKADHFRYGITMFPIYDEQRALQAYRLANGCLPECNDVNP